MLKLIKLELRQTKITPYLIASVAISAFLLFTLVSNITQAALDKSAQRTIISNLPLNSHFLENAYVTIFGIMGAVIFSRLIVSSYTDKHPVLLFSYPVSRTKIFLAKVLLAGGFTLTAFLASSLLAGLVLMFFEPVSSKLLYDFGLAELGMHMMISLTAGLLSVALASVGLLVGFLMKSMPATIVVVMIAAMVVMNLISGRFGEGIVVLTVIAGLSLLLIVGVVALLAARIRRMEV